MGATLKKPLLLTSSQNPIIKQTLQLRRKRERDASQKFLIEGYREIARAFDAEVAFETLLFSPNHFLGTNEWDLLKLAAKRKIPTFQIAPSLFDKLSYRDRPDGLLAIAKQTHCTLSHLDRLTPPFFFLVVEAIEKPGNLGAMLRSCDGAGVDALIICDPCTDLYNPNVVRASVGTLFTVPTIETTFHPLVTFLRENEIQIIVTSPHAPTPFTQIDLTPSVAILVGTEQFGLSQKWLDVGEEKVHIPMRGVADSLNVATAATLLLYEVIRQRAISP